MVLTSNLEPQSKFGQNQHNGLDLGAGLAAVVQDQPVTNFLLSSYNYWDIVLHKSSNSLEFVAMVLGLYLFVTFQIITCISFINLRALFTFFSLQT